MAQFPNLNMTFGTANETFGYPGARIIRQIIKIFDKYILHVIIFDIITIKCIKSSDINIMFFG